MYPLLGTLNRLHPPRTRQAVPGACFFGKSGAVPGYRPQVPPIPRGGRGAGSPGHQSRFGYGYVDLVSSWNVDPLTHQYASHPPSNQLNAGQST
ncbi:hypothetical protein PTTG_04294 [Puccinia triticina 1-1 BBBD Race 1]|uniref:Uncharacterized protein n=1 Tax=Puccinia triticina (isolate 1-1 / race 1 (BBBD)) TaxID=630390 RepID=A0A0C4EU15_PUCT1|nr:hypothetical protein PTTG_04294 [Puccinia triticina 1-1 BBBD Race 1]